MASAAFKCVLCTQWRTAADLEQLPALEPGLGHHCATVVRSDLSAALQTLGWGCRRRRGLGWVWRRLRGLAGDIGLEEVQETEWFVFLKKFYFRADKKAQ